MATSFYPQLFDLLDLSQLPAPFDGLADAQAALDSTFYQNLALDLTLDSGDFAAASGTFQKRPSARPSLPKPSREQ